MTDLQFEAWPKTPRLNRDVLFTEKIDGTNAAVVIVGQRHDQDGYRFWGTPEGTQALLDIVEREDGQRFAVFAQSRTRFITPGKATDNYGFAGWVKENAQALAEDLGPGTHYGEWWGAGIQRGYGLPGGDKRFSLFNATRWFDLETRIPGLGVVPVLPFDRIEQAADAADCLRRHGSLAMPGFDRPEGIIAFHTAARTSFKVLLEGDDFPKGLAA